MSKSLNINELTETIRDYELVGLDVEQPAHGCNSELSFLDMLIMNEVILGFSQGLGFCDYMEVRNTYIDSVNI